LLTATLTATLALAPLEGYLQMVNGSLGKLASGLFLLTWVWDRAWRRRPFGTGHPVVAGIGALFVVVLLSAVAHLDNGLAGLAVSRWLPFLVLCVAIVDVVTHDVAPRTALAALLIGAVAAGAGALFSFVLLGDARASGPLSDPNDLAYVLTASLPLAASRIGTTRGARRLALVLAAALLLAGTAVTVSRGGAIAIAAVTVWIAARRVIPPRLLLGAAAVVVVVGGIGALLAAPQIRTALAQKDYIASTNVATRELRWQAALRMLGANPLGGVGPGGFPGGYVKYSGFAELAERTPVTHEMYLEVGAELGVPGLALFLGLIALAAVCSELTIRRLRRARAPDDDPVLLAAYGAQGLLLAVCITSSFLSEEYYMPLWAGIGICAALELRTRPGGVAPPPRRPRRRRRRSLFLLLPPRLGDLLSPVPTQPGPPATTFPEFRSTRAALGRGLPAMPPTSPVSPQRPGPRGPGGGA
jgi:O-antigen ligase